MGLDDGASRGLPLAGWSDRFLDGQDRQTTPI